MEARVDSLTGVQCIKTDIHCLHDYSTSGFHSY